MFKIFKTPLEILTPYGYKKAMGMRKIQAESVRLHYNNSFIDASLNHRFVLSAENPEITKMAKEYKIGDKLGDYVVTKITHLGIIDVYDFTDVDGAIYQTNNITSHNCEFLGSSDTLISGESLKEIENRTKDIETQEGIINGLKIYKKVQPGNSYICSVDPSKDGQDEFSINIVNISKFPFEQVAWANLQVDYITMPEQLETLGLYYNEALMIIENNEGAGQSISDTLYNVYEYPNIYRDKNIDNRIGFKKYTGFRTTTKTRASILSLLKIFVEENKLIINSAETLTQLYTFTKNKQNKYTAEEGYKDDAVMSLAIMFAPFMENKRFDDFKLFVKEIKMQDSELRVQDIMSVLDIGSVDDGVDYEEQARKEELRKLIESDLGGYSLDY